MIKIVAQMLSIGLIFSDMPVIWMDTWMIVWKNSKCNILEWQTRADKIRQVGLPAFAGQYQVFPDFCNRFPYVLEIHLN